MLRSFLVCFWYDFKAALKMAWKREEGAVVVDVSDMIGVVDNGKTDQVMERG